MSKKLSNELNKISQDLKTSAGDDSDKLIKQLLQNQKKDREMFSKRLEVIEKQIDKLDERVMDLNYSARDELSNSKELIKDLKE